MLALGACAGSRTPPPDLSASLPPRPWVAEPISCVPYARARSGIQISGDAWTWWDAAAGRYARGQAPRPGSVLVIARSSRLRSGHVSVVTRVLSSREVLVDHANWASGSARGRIAVDQRVVDVSAGNDWTLVRVWYPRIDQLGITAFPAHGFIHNETHFAAR